MEEKEDAFARQLQADQDEYDEKMRERRHRMNNESSDWRNGDESDSNRYAYSEGGAAMDPEEYAQRVAAGKRVQKVIVRGVLSAGVIALLGAAVCAVASATGASKSRIF